MKVFDKLKLISWPMTAGLDHFQAGVTTVINVVITILRLAIIQLTEKISITADWIVRNQEWLTSSVKGSWSISMKGIKLIVWSYWNQWKLIHLFLKHLCMNWQLLLFSLTHHKNKRNKNCKSQNYQPVAIVFPTGKYSAFSFVKTLSKVSPKALP